MRIVSVIWPQDEPLEDFLRKALPFVRAEKDRLALTTRDKPLGRLLDIDLIPGKYIKEGTFFRPHNYTVLLKFEGDQPENTSNDH